MNKKEQRIKNKKTYYKFSRELLNVNSKNLKAIVSKYCHHEIEWNGPNPYQVQNGLETHLKEFWEPFINAFPNIEKNSYVLLGGEDKDGREWVSSTGYYRATFVNDWLGIPHTGRPMFIRFGEWCRMEHDKILEVYVILDIIDVMRIAGVNPVYPWWGSSELALGPATQDGLWIRDYDEDEAKTTLNIISKMGDSLVSYDFKNLKSMHQWDYWDVDRMIWAGPGGIGQTRGLKGFENYHQLPWLRAFPDRSTHGPNQEMPGFAEANFSCVGCWSGGSNPFGTHTGGDLMGMGATGKAMHLRDFDWYRVENGKIIENWCMIDNIHLLDQLGVNLFDRMEKMIRTDMNNTYGGR